MTTNVTPSSGAPSGQESIEAMYYHREKSGIFAMIARHPQVGVYENFLKEWAIVVAYVERKVHRCKRAVDAVYQKRKDHGRLDDFEDEETLESLTHALSLHSQVVECLQKRSLAPSPSKFSMNLYRSFVCTGEAGARAANGELASRYGLDGEAVSSRFAVGTHENLTPMALFIYDRLVRPLFDRLSGPSKKIWLLLPLYKVDRQVREHDNAVVTKDTMEAIANALVYVLATLILMAPIAILNSIESQTIRIAVMPFFGLLLVASAQLMGPTSMPIYQLVTAYFQVMVIYVAVTSDRQVRG